MKVKKLYLGLLLFVSILGVLFGCHPKNNSSQQIESSVIQDNLEIRFIEEYSYRVDNFDEDHRLDFFVTIKNSGDEGAITLLHPYPLCGFVIVDNKGNPVIERIALSVQMTSVLNPGETLNFRDDFTLEEIQTLDKGNYIVIAVIQYRDADDAEKNNKIRLELPFEIQ